MSSCGSVNYSVKPDEQSQIYLNYAMAKNSLILMNVVAIESIKLVISLL